VELTHDFDVSVPIDRAWAVLTDVERIAPCLPGAQLQEVEGDEYRGVVKVKVGPITAQYKGKAVFVEQDAVAHRAVLEASGRDTRGQGNASATITAELTAQGEGTRVALTTDLTISGKVAQFGRGALADVSQKLLGQFVENLESTVLAAETHEPGTDPGSQGPRSVPGSGEVEPIDLLDAGAPVIKRALPIIVIAVVALVLMARRRRRRRRG
jgi:carbon monoxide dehydrogenase subunit G